MKALGATLCFILALTACDGSSPVGPGLTPPFDTSVAVPAETAEAIRNQLELADRTAREAAGAFIRECNQPDAHPLRCAGEGMPGSLRYEQREAEKTCRRLTNDYNALVTSGAKIQLLQTENRKDPGRVITCDGAK